MTTVRIAIAGPEVAKWLARLSHDKWQRPGTPVAPGIAVVGSSLPVYIDFDDDLRLPTLGDDAEVELVVGRKAFTGEPPEDPAQLAAAAIEAANTALEGLLSRVEHLRVEVASL